MLTPATVIDRAADTVRLASTNVSLSAGLPEWRPVDAVVVVGMVPSACAVTVDPRTPGRDAASIELRSDPRANCV